ncbi:MAG: site-specific DNA-methyltransferase [Candidatus Pseudobacter hemicellulosilyticus]|uniref:Methyltransferase n=1 Tax=Candidatus Pseudobacter hemicellulosilyticus TaxID=3121375 RepID=A0AAJ5X0G5_9BACT|nr:MAG: site-specific DNA-methyltransferase [Pseudobacter sp.]
MQNHKIYHTILSGNAQKVRQIKNHSIDLVVTSPPYPMIEMWDEVMSGLNPEIRLALSENDGNTAFEMMHQELDKVWKEIYRVLKPGGIVCINIGDATRTLDGNFALYPNHSRIIASFLKLGFSNLPNIIWRKQTNSPNKFMGSGMLPAGAYVTLEHEWILIFRKGQKRVFSSENEKSKRRNSSFFWEERNNWFSDLWEFKGTRQFIENSESRDRSAAYPFELPYRLINMYSVKGDVVFDPFLGTGTTTIAAIASERSSVGVEIDKAFLTLIKNRIAQLDIDRLNYYISERLKQHNIFVREYKKEFKHYNHFLKSPVVTSQETELQFSYLIMIKKKSEDYFEIEYQTIEADNIDVPIIRKEKKQPSLGF